MGVTARMTLTRGTMSPTQKVTHRRVLQIPVPESATGDDCPTCLETDDMAVRSIHKRFCKKVQASCSPSKQEPWKGAQMEQIGNHHNTVWGISLLIRSPAPLKWVR